MEEHGSGGSRYKTKVQGISRSCLMPQYAANSRLKCCMHVPEIRCFLAECRWKCLELAATTERPNQDVLLCVSATPVQQVTGINSVPLLSLGAPCAARPLRAYASVHVHRLCSEKA